MTRFGFTSRRRVARAVTCVAAVTSLATVFGAAAPTGAAPVRPADATPVQPNRVLDTRSGTGAPAGKVGPGRMLSLPVPGAPAGATSVQLNVTATEADGPGWVKVWPCGSPEPSTSALNYVPGQIAANAVVVKVGTGGAICMSTYAPVHLVADVSGWFTGSADFTGTTPSRVLDTRTTGDPLRAGVERRLHLAGTAGVGSAATLAALNLTVVDPPQAGWVVAYPCGAPTTSSTVNFTAGEIVANLSFVGLSSGDVCLRSYGTTDLVVDTYGWSAGAGMLKVQSPQRLLDTRSWAYGQLQTGSRIQLRVAGKGGIPNDAAAAMLTVTVADTSGPGFVTAWPCDQPLPDTSTINTWPNQLRSNLALVKLASTDGTACLQLYTSNNSPLDLVVDAVGWETGGPQRSAPPAVPTPPTAPPAPAVPSGHFATLAPGSTLPTDAQCAAAVRTTPEIRTDNTTANHTKGNTPQTDPYYKRVTGNFTGTTDEIIQWAACKWGIDEDIVRAQAAKESYWHQNAGGDLTTDTTRCAPGAPRTGNQCAESVGLMQVRYPYWSAGFPSSLNSTAYNLDYALAARRHCYEGLDTWLGGTYTKGDLWGCVGMWFSGAWHDPGAETYITAVKDYLNQRIWTTSTFING